MKIRTIHLTLFFCFLIFSHSLFAADGTWDVLDKNMSAWDSDNGADNNKAWKRTKNYLNVAQKSGYVNINKTSGADGYLSPTAYPATVKTNAYTIDVKLKVNPIGLADTETAFESNQIAICIGGKQMKIFLKYGDQNSGYLCYTQATTHSNDEKQIVNTSDWHVYRFVYYPSTYTYDVFIDNAATPAFSTLKTHYNGSVNNVLIGSDQNRNCNMDIEYVKFGTGNFALKTQINSVAISSDSHIVGNARTIKATVNTDLVSDGQAISLALFDENDNSVTTPLNLNISGGTATSNLTIPANLPKGRYFVKAFVNDDLIGQTTINPKSIAYDIVGPSPLTTNILPQVQPKGFIIETEDYQIPSPTNEYIFPCIIDAKKHAVNGGEFLNSSALLDRYYWYHTPHDDPGGMYLYTGPSLDGPWTERGLVLTNDWAKAQGINTSHISSCHIIWNDVYQKYFMYFHGDNNRTHYATSDDLYQWTYGAQVVQYDDFSFSSREASYAKVFEYSVPGYDNKYVLMLMINENDKRTIYWAHSVDGITWKAVRKPLITPTTSYKKVPGTDTKPSYSNNVSGPFFMIADGRYFVFFHSSAGNISVVEIGENFDMEIHWGTYLNKSNVLIQGNGSGGFEAVSRVASPFFIQDDLGVWYLFFEAGHRLGANTAYAKGNYDPTKITESYVDNEKLLYAYSENGLCIIHNAHSGSMPYKIYTIDGALLKQGVLNHGDNDINLEKGIYLIQTENGNKQPLFLKIIHH